jgi:hypothetical protein
MHRIVFVNFSECKQCRLLCWRTYQVFSKMTYIYEVSSFAYIMTDYTTSLPHLNYIFQKFHKLERTFAECTFVCLPIFLQFLFLFCPHTLRFWPTIHKRTTWSLVIVKNYYSKETVEQWLMYTLNKVTVKLMYTLYKDLTNFSKKNVESV